MNDRKEDEDLFCETNQALFKEIDAKARELGLGWQLTVEKENTDQQREYRIQLLAGGGRVFWKIGAPSIRYALLATMLRLEACLETYKGQTKKPRDCSKGINVLPGPLRPGIGTEVVLGHLNRPNGNGVCYTVRDSKRLLSMLNQRPRLAQLDACSAAIADTTEQGSAGLTCGKIEHFSLDTEGVLTGMLTPTGPQAHLLTQTADLAGLEFEIRTVASGEGNPRVLHDVSVVMVTVIKIPSTESEGALHGPSHQPRESTAPGQDGVDENDHVEQHVHALHADAVPDPRKARDLRA